VQFLGQDLTRLTEKARCQIRNQSLGFIYQFHHLLPELTALENVAMPLWLGRVSIKESQKRALSMLDDVGLLARAAHKPGQLSGGERQRVAIARALVHRPQCVLADEPTGNLDHSTATQVFDLMLRLNETHDTALVVVTHDLAIAARMDKIMHLQDGLLKDSE
jgi:lipoprotein-releasing system ATP-binding protein